MDNLKMEKYLEIANKKKMEEGLNNYAPLYPMFRVIDNKLYVGVLLTDLNENIWSLNEKIKPSYWVLIDIYTNEIVEFNKTSDKDFVVGKLIEKDVLTKQKELSKYTVEKVLQYKNYLMDDIKNEKLPLQKKLSDIFGNEIKIDDNMVNINDYLLSRLEGEVKEKINELVDILLQSKYGSIIYYYDMLFESIINEYKDNGVINREQLKLCIDCINHYYDGVIGIDNFFNI